METQSEFAGADKSGITQGQVLHENKFCEIFDCNKQAITSFPRKITELSAKTVYLFF